MDFEQILMDLKNKKFQPIYFLMGEETYFIDEITDYIAAHVLTNEEKVFNQLGLSMTQAITLFFKQVNMYQGLPFVVAIPNAETRQALEDALAGKNLHKAENLDALFDELEA